MARTAKAKEPLPTASEASRSSQSRATVRRSKKPLDPDRATLAEVVQDVHELRSVLGMPSSDVEVNHG